jgi:hypothetical protein
MLPYCIISLDLNKLLLSTEFPKIYDVQEGL